MKRKLILSIFAALLAVAMLLPLASCGLIEQNGGNETAAPTQGPQIVPTPSKEVTNDSSSDVEHVFPDLPPEEIVQGVFPFSASKDNGCDPSNPLDIVYQIPKSVSLEDEWVPVRIFFGMHNDDENWAFDRYLIAESRSNKWICLEKIEGEDFGRKYDVFDDVFCEETGLNYTFAYSKTYLIPMEFFRYATGEIQFSLTEYVHQANNISYFGLFAGANLYCRFDDSQMTFSDKKFNLQLK